jgi:hypothetical protein
MCSLKKHNKREDKQKRRGRKGAHEDKSTPKKLTDPKQSRHGIKPIQRASTRDGDTMAKERINSNIGTNYKNHKLQKASNTI